MDRWVKETWYTYIKNEVLPLVPTWVDLEGLRLNKISQAKKRQNGFTCMQNRKKKTTEHAKQKQTRNTETNDGGHREGDGVGKKVKGHKRHTLPDMK